ncbi:alanine or glycine:cation symporter, AGCS family [Terribacillus aidingensis]|uniref:Alanine or glycine:cation symporter, AGCS family n=2 Tax=Terribacillus aidingensis TaxID=586416 RepID=A0A285P114_9BACI|nr:alanine or glycine:cation symporter, AGCS family [Terribacillus aidingensis]
MGFEAILGKVSEYLWSVPMLVFIAVVAGVYTIATGFLQVRFFKDMITQTFTGKSSASGVSPFQALVIGLSGRVGTGNIAGVATAIAAGGPGAVFWMWFIAFFGSAAAFAESTLAQIYKKRVDGEYRGGPAYYAEKGLGWKWYGYIFAVVAAVSTCLLTPGIQANAIAESMNNAFGITPLITGIALVAIVGYVIFGGIRRIAFLASYVVPIMALFYLLVAAIVIFANIEQVPSTFALIFSSAFGVDSAFGGIIGAAISWGVKRGLYSNEAGQGTGAQAAAAAEVSHPVKQGLVQSFSVYIDTLLICTATALMILMTGNYSVENPDGGFLVDYANGMEAGAGYTQAAVDGVLGGFGSAFVAISLFFFAFTTLVAYFYIAETNLFYIVRGEKRKIFSNIMKPLFLAAVFFGTVRSASFAWTLADIGLGLMVWVNLIAVILLYKPTILAFKDYQTQKREGLDPVFRPSQVDIKNADYWEERELEEEMQRKTV